VDEAAVWPGLAVSPSYLGAGLAVRPPVRWCVSGSHVGWAPPWVWSADPLERAAR
jgi:hypothetical protein